MRPSEALDKIPSGSLGELPLLIKVNTTLVPIFPFCPSLPGGPVLPSAPVSPLGPEEKKKRNEQEKCFRFGNRACMICIHVLLKLLIKGIR